MNYVWISWLAELGRVMQLDEFREIKEQTGLPPAKPHKRTKNHDQFKEPQRPNSGSTGLMDTATRVARKVGIPRTDLLENWQTSRFRMRLCLP